MNYRVIYHKLYYLIKIHLIQQTLVFENCKFYDEYSLNHSLVQFGLALVGGFVSLFHSWPS